jgi:hypothetical protein
LGGVNLEQETPMRRISLSRVALLSLMAFALVGFHAGPAAALKITEIKKVSAGSLKSTCDNVGGTFSQNPGATPARRKIAMARAEPARSIAPRPQAVAPA